MNNADKFKQIFDLYATELWAMSEKDFLAWLNAERDVSGTKQLEIVRCKDCKWWGLSEYNTFGIHVCKKFSGVRGESDFCSRAERSEE